VFKSDFNDRVSFNKVLGKCFVMFVKEYFKNKPEVCTMTIVCRLLVKEDYVVSYLNLAVVFLTTGVKDLLGCSKSHSP
jgi:hypothetical protein